MAPWHPNLRGLSAEGGVSRGLGVRLGPQKTQPSSDDSLVDIYMDYKYPRNLQFTPNLSQHWPWLLDPTTAL